MEEARKENSSLFGIFITSSSVKKIPVFLEFLLRANFFHLHIWNAGFSHENRSVLKKPPRAMEGGLTTKDFVATSYVNHNQGFVLHPAFQ